MKINDTTEAQVWQFQQAWVPMKALEQVPLGLTPQFPLPADGEHTT